MKTMLEPSKFDLPDVAALRKTVEAFKKSLEISHTDAREIERKTCEQRLSSLWYSVRHYRLTASRFGDVANYPSIEVSLMYSSTY